MLTKNEFESLISDHMNTPIRASVAKKYLKSWGTYSGPACVMVGGSKKVVIKGRHTDKQAVSDQVIARLGTALGAPVGKPVLVRVTQKLIDSAKWSHLQAFSPGLAHGVYFIENCRDRTTDYKYFVNLENNIKSNTQNKRRCAFLAILYGWVFACDEQFMFNKDTNLIYSVDHGHFFCGGHGWDAKSISSDSYYAKDVVPSKYVKSIANLKKEDFKPALQRLSKITDKMIAEAIGTIPKNWSITMEERVALAQYLSHRRDSMLKNCAS